MIKCIKKDLWGIMELLQLAYFCNAAQTQNFSHTAENFKVPTSNISRAVRALEGELGVKLFTRFANKVQLNEYGERFYLGAKAALDSLDGAKNAVLENKEEPEGTVRLLISTNRRIVTRAIETCKRLYPKISFVISHGFYKGGYDVVVSDVPPQSYCDAGHLLLNERIVLATAKKEENHLKSRAELSDFSNEQFISMTKGTRLYELSLDICRRSGFEPKIVIETDDPFYVRKYVELGLGISLVPEASWEGLFSENISLINVGDFYRRTYAFLNDLSNLPLHISLFFDILKKTFSEEAENYHKGIE